MQFLLCKVYVFISQVNDKNKRVLPIPYCYFYGYKTIEDCTGAEEACVELASKVDRILYTGKAE